MNTRIIVLGLLMVLSLPVFGQETQFKLEVIDFISTKKDVSFNLSISNVSDSAITTYLPTKDDICLRIIGFKFVDIKNGKTHQIGVCTTIIDLDKIMLNCNNTLYLNPGEKYEQKFKFSKKDIVPHLQKKRTYQFMVEWNLKDIYFETSVANLFQEDLKSNVIQFQN
jgi:hypothetical protein